MPLARPTRRRRQWLRRRNSETGVDLVSLRQGWCGNIATPYGDGVEVWRAVCSMVRWFYLQCWRALVSGLSVSMNCTKVVIALAAFAVLSGCEGAAGPGGDPGASALPAGETCGSIREKLNALDRKGAQKWVEAQTAGRKLTATQKAGADSYNRLLGQYLGSRCHV